MSFLRVQCCHLTSQCPRPWMVGWDTGSSFSEVLWELRWTIVNTENLPWSLISEWYALTRSRVRDGNSQTVPCCLAPLWLFCAETLIHLSSITHLWSLHEPLFPLEASQILVSAQAPSAGHTCCEGYASISAWVSSHPEHLPTSLISTRRSQNGAEVP